MATIKNGIHGAFSGKVGKIVGYVRKGQAIIRTQGERTTPPTQKELLNREKFAISQKWLSPLIDFLRIGFKDYQPTYEGFLAAKSYNQKNAMNCDENDKFFIDPTLALLSFGNQQLPLTANAQTNKDQEIIFKWSTEGVYEYNDQAMVVAYDIENAKVIYNPGIARRQTGTAILKLATTDVKKTYHVYLAFISDNRTSKSNSMYLGSLQIS